ncbi:MAG: hypothetical protein JNM27_17525 [Leptospirales bacterium]|nr:hypothetical protein [Leptospirales bacterium]
MPSFFEKIRAVPGQLGEAVGRLAFEYRDSPILNITGIKVDWFAMLAILLLICGAALVVMWYVIDRFQAKGDESIVADREFENAFHSNAGDTGSESIPEIKAMPSGQAALDLRSISYEDAQRLNPGFFNRPVSAELREAMDFPANLEDLLKRFAQRISGKTHADSISIFLRDDMNRYNPRIHLSGSIFVSGRSVAEFTAGNIGESALEKLQSNRVVLDEDAHQVAFPLQSPTELAGYLLIKNESSSLFNREALHAIFNETQQFAVILYHHIRHLHNRPLMNDGIQLREDLGLLCAQGTAAFALSAIEIAPSIQAERFGDRVYHDNGLVFLLGPIKTEATLDQEFRQLVKERHTVIAGIATCSGGEQPERVLRRAYAALEDARRAGPNHYRILTARAA